MKGIGYQIDSKEQVGPDDTLKNKSLSSSTELNAQSGYPREKNTLCQLAVTLWWLWLHFGNDRFTKV